LLRRCDAPNRNKYKKINWQEKNKSTQKAIAKKETTDREKAKKKTKDQNSRMITTPNTFHHIVQPETYHNDMFSTRILAE